MKSEHAYMFQICSLTARGSSGWSHPFCFLTQAAVQLEIANISANSCAVNVQMASATGTADLRCENQYIRSEQLTLSCKAGEAADFIDLTSGCTYHIFGRPAGSDSGWAGPLTVWASFAQLFSTTTCSDRWTQLVHANWTEDDTQAMK